MPTAFAPNFQSYYNLAHVFEENAIQALVHKGEGGSTYKSVSEIYSACDNFSIANKIFSGLLMVRNVNASPNVFNRYLSMGIHAKRFCIDEQKVSDHSSFCEVNYSVYDD